MRESRTFGIRKLKSRALQGGALSNIKKLEEDFAKSVSFGKTVPSLASADSIRKKFSI